MKLGELSGDDWRRFSDEMVAYETAKSAAFEPDAPWRPAETAPRDGTMIIARMDGQPTGVRWTEDRLSAISPGYDGYAGPGWQDVENGWVNYEHREFDGWLPIDQNPTVPEGY